MIGAGDLRQRVGFYSKIAGSDGYGNEEIGYGMLPDVVVAAAIVPRLGGEAVLAGRLVGTNFVNITIRNSSLVSVVTDDWMARDERTGEAYNIRSIIDPFKGTPQRGRYLELLCEEGVAIGPMASAGALDFSYPDLSGLIALLEDV